MSQCLAGTPGAQTCLESGCSQKHRWPPRRPRVSAARASQLPSSKSRAAQRADMTAQCPTTPTDERLPQCMGGHHSFQPLAISSGLESRQQWQCGWGCGCGRHAIVPSALEMTPILLLRQLCQSELYPAILGPAMPRMTERTTPGDSLDAVHSTPGAAANDAVHSSFAAVCAEKPEHRCRRRWIRQEPPALNSQRELSAAVQCNAARAQSGTQWGRAPPGIPQTDAQTCAGTRRVPALYF